MADITSYALSIDLVLQSNVDQVLDSALTKIESLEARVQNLAKNTSNMLDKMGGNIASNFTKISESFGKTSKTISQTDISQSVRNFAKETSGATQNVEGLNKQLGLPEAMLDRLSSAMRSVAQIRYLRGEDLDYAVEQYKYLSDTAIPYLMDLMEKRSKKGIGMAEEEMVLIRQFSSEKSKLLTQEAKLAYRHYDLRKRYEKQIGKTLDNRIKTKSDIIKMSEKERDLYEEILEIQEQRNKISEALSDSVEDRAEAQKKVLDIRQAKNYIGGLRAMGKVWSSIKDTIGSIGQGLRKTLDTVGLGELTKMASAAGIYSVAVDRAAKREELFHELHYQTMGGMEALSERTLDLAGQYDVMAEELEQSIVAMRSVGFQNAEAVDTIGVQMQILKRNAGASNEVMARMALNLTSVTGNTKAATKQLLWMNRASKEIGLTGSDLDQILSNIGESAVVMGDRGGVFAERYSKALMRAAGGAKKLGMNTSDAVSVVKRMLDPLQSVAFIGQDAFNLMDDPAAMQKRLAEQATQWLEILDDMEGGRSKIAKIQDVGTRIGMQGAHWMDIMKAVRLLASGQEDFDKVAEESADPMKEMNATLDKTNTLIRDLKTTVDDIKNSLETTHSYLKSIAESSIGFLDTPWVKTLASWGITITAFSGLLGSVGSLLGGVTRGILGVGKAALEAFPFVGKMLGGLVSKMKGAAGYVANFFRQMFAGVTGKGGGFIGRGFSIIGDKVSGLFNMLKGMSGLRVLQFGFWAAIAAEIYILAKGVYDTHKAFKEGKASIEEGNKALDRRRDKLLEQKKIMQGIHEEEIKQLRTKLTKLRIEQMDKAEMQAYSDAIDAIMLDPSAISKGIGYLFGDDTGVTIKKTKEIMELENKLNSLVVAQAKANKAVIGDVNVLDKQYQEAIKQGNLAQAIILGIRKEALRTHKPITELYKDQEGIKKITADITAEHEKMIAIREKEKKKIQEQKRIEQVGITASKEKLIFEKNMDHILKERQKTQKDITMKDLLDDSRLVADQMTRASDEAKKLKDSLTVDKQIEQFEDLTEAVQNMFALEPDAENPFGDYESESLEQWRRELVKAEQALKNQKNKAMGKVNEAEKATEKMRARPNEVAKVKIDEDSARPPKEENKELQTTNTLLNDISNKSSNKDVAEILISIRDLLEAKQETSSGLTVQANQWVS